MLTQIPLNQKKKSDDAKDEKVSNKGLTEVFERSKSHAVKRMEDPEHERMIRNQKLLQ